jgi:hypothetical protein
VHEIPGVIEAAITAPIIGVGFGTLTIVLRNKWMPSRITIDGRATGCDDFSEELLGLLTL